MGPKCLDSVFTWVGDGVGGPFSGDKAYRKFALNHHPDKMKSSMKVVLKGIIFCKMAFQFPGSKNMTPNRVNRAKIGKMLSFFGFFGPWEKWFQMAPNRAGRIFFLLIQTLPTFWAERIWILRCFMFFTFWTPNFWISGVGASGGTFQTNSP